MQENSAHAAAEARSSSATNPTFRDIALPLANRGIKVIPVQPLSKRGVLLDQFRHATTSPEQIERWDAENPDYNVGCVGSPDGIVILDCDVKGLLRRIEQETGRKFPDTLVVRSAGKGCAHVYFRQTAASRELGNQKKAGLFDLQSVDRYVVGPGSRLDNGRTYGIVRDFPIAPIPDWVCDWIAANADSSKPERHTERKDSRSVDEAFDFGDFCDWYGISGQWDGEWFVTDVCPVAGRRHEQSTRTGFFFDGNSLGFHCFASGCEGSGMTVGRVIAFLNRDHEPYKGRIWEEEAIWEEEVVEDVPGGMHAGAPEDEPEDASAEPGVDPAAFLNCDPEPQSPEQEAPATEPAKANAAAFDDLVEEMAKADAPLPAPVAVAIEDPAQHEGLEFPGGCAMYGKLAEIAWRFPRLQLGWLYPALLGVASALDIEDEDGNVRSNMYVALLGDIGFGKTVCVDAAAKSVFIPGRETTVSEEVPSSDRGLANMLSDSEPVPRLLLLDEMKALMQKCAIQSSALPQMICQLWSKTKAGVADKKGRQPCFGRLSILGNLACKDPGDFAKLFGNTTVSGMSDRFLFGFSDVYVKYRPVRPKAEFVEPKPVRIPEWVWDAKDEWGSDIPERRRMTEHALRVALVAAAVNGDREITKECLEAAFRFCEWQLRIRAIYRPGLAETKEAECFEAVYAALRERHNKQNHEQIVPRGAEGLSLDMDKSQRWRLLHFAQVVNAKSYYRKYAGLIDRVRKSMLDNGVITDVREIEFDERGHGKKGVKTPFVVLKGNLR